MRFQTDRPGELAGLHRLRQRDGGDRSRTRAASVCGGLLEIHHRPPDADADGADRALHRAARAAQPGAPASGVWRFREIVLPSRGARSSPTRKGTRRCCTASRWTAGPALEHLLLKHEGHNPTGSFKDRGMTVGVTQARRIGATRGGLRLHREHLGLARGLRGAGGDSRPWCWCRPDGVAIGKLAQSLAYGARTLLVRGDFDDCLRLVEEASARARRLPAQLDQPVPDRGAEDDRAGDAAAARLGIAGLDRAARPATWATPPRSGRRCGRHDAGA